MSQLYETPNGPMVRRDRYLDVLKEMKDRTDLVKVITGVRRCGKSTLMEQYIDWLLDSGVPEEDILHVNLESMGDSSVRTKDDLFELVRGRRSGRMLYVLVDEVQRLEGWAEAVNGLGAEKDVDVYITGSNAFLLSSELRTYLTGREYEIRMLPLSFEEFLCKNPPDASADRNARFMQYIRWGGMPAVDLSKSERFNMQLLDGIFGDIMFKDVVTRLSDRVDTSKLRRVSSFLMHNIGNLTSSKGVADGAGIDPKTAHAYFEALSMSFLFYEAPRYDLIGSRLLNGTEKIYAVDTGMRNAVLENLAGNDISRPLENIVYLELLRRGYTVTVGCYRDREVDFTAMRNGKVEFYQVALTVMEDSTMERERRSLADMKNSFPKTILTLDAFARDPGLGILHRNVVDWLLEDR